MQLLLPCFVVCLSQAHCIRKRKSCGSVFITICAGCRTGMGIKMKISAKIRSRWAVLAVCLILVAAPLCARAVNEWKAAFAAVADQELQEAYQALSDEMEARSIQPDEGGLGDVLVWIPKSGSKYHSKPNCSRMKNPRQVTLEAAIQAGYGPCSKCN